MARDLQKPSKDAQKSFKKQKLAKSLKKSKLLKKAKPKEKPIVNAHESVFKNDLWTAQDDKLLLENIESCHDITAIYKCVKFSQNFPVCKILERWQAILEDNICQNFVNKRLFRLRGNQFDDFLDRRKNTADIAGSGDLQPGQSQSQCKTSENRPVYSSKNDILPSYDEIYELSRISSTILEKMLLTNFDFEESKFMTTSMGLGLSLLTSHHLKNSKKLAKIFKNDRNFHIWSNLRWNHLLCDQQVAVEAEGLSKGKFAEFFGWERDKTSNIQTRIEVNNIFDGDGNGNGGEKVGEQKMASRNSISNHTPKSKLVGNESFKIASTVCESSDTRAGALSNADMHDSNVKFEISKSLKEDTKIFKNQKLVTFEEKLSDANELMNSGNFRGMMAVSRGHREKNLCKIKEYNNYVPKIAFKANHILGQLSGNFHKYNLRSNSTFIFSDPISDLNLSDQSFSDGQLETGSPSSQMLVIDMEMDDGSPSILDDHRQKGKNPTNFYYNLNYEHSYANAPKYMFKISYNYTKKIIEIKNLTNFASDIAVFICREDQTECLLNGETCKLRHNDMVVVYEMKFIFYENFNFNPNKNNQIKAQVKSISPITVPEPIKLELEVVDNSCTPSMSDIESQVTVIPADKASI